MASVPNPDPATTTTLFCSLDLDGVKLLLTITLPPISEDPALLGDILRQLPGTFPLPYPPACLPTYLLGSCFPPSPARDSILTPRDRTSSLDHVFQHLYRPVSAVVGRRPSRGDGGACAGPNHHVAVQQRRNRLPGQLRRRGGGRHARGDADGHQPRARHGSQEC